MGPFGIILLATVFTMIIKFVFSVEEEVKKIESKSKQCKIHTWDRVNNILLCSKCGWAPEVEEKLNKKFDDLD